MTEPESVAGYKEHTTRIISGRLLVGILLVPFVFAWFLLRPGYSNTARIIGLGWAAFAFIGFLATQGVNEAGKDAQPSIAANDTDAEQGLKPPAKSASAPALPDEGEYLDLLDGLEQEVRTRGLVQYEDTPQTSWAVSVGTMGNIATALEERKKYTLSVKAQEKDQAVRHIVVSKQAKAFPLLRALYAKAVAERVWEHDVEVEARGTANRTLRLTGYWFAANRNIKTIMETLHEDALALRFSRVEFRAHKLDGSTYYDLKPLPDTQIATFSFNRWTPIEE